MPEFPSVIKVSRPFLTQHEIDELQSLTGVKGSAAIQQRVQAFNLMKSISLTMKFPVRTLDTAMSIYKRTVLFNVPKLPFVETVVASMLVASKAEDTPKRSKNLASCAMQCARNLALSSTQLDEVKSTVVGLERQILETIGFDFRIRHAHSYVTKMCRFLDISDKEIAQTAWVIASDLTLTDSPLKFPSHTTALACIELAVQLHNSQTGGAKVDLPRAKLDDLYSDPRSVNLVLSDLLDFYIHYLNLSQLGSVNSNVGTFMSLRMDITRKLADGEPIQEPPSESQSLRDPRLSDKGTVRYVLDWEMEHVASELVQAGAGH